MMHQREPEKKKGFAIDCEGTVVPHQMFNAADNAIYYTVICPQIRSIPKKIYAENLLDILSSPMLSEEKRQKAYKEYALLAQDFWAVKKIGLTENKFQETLTYEMKFSENGKIKSIKPVATMGQIKENLNVKKANKLLLKMSGNEELKLCHDLIASHYEKKGSISFDQITFYTTRLIQQFMPEFMLFNDINGICKLNYRDVHDIHKRIFISSTELEEKIQSMESAKLEITSSSTASRSTDGYINIFSAREYQLNAENILPAIVTEAAARFKTYIAA